MHLSPPLRPLGAELKLDRCLVLPYDFAFNIVVPIASSHPLFGVPVKIARLGVHVVVCAGHLRIYNVGYLRKLCSAEDLLCADDNLAAVLVNQVVGLVVMPLAVCVVDSVCKPLVIRLVGGSKQVGSVLILRQVHVFSESFLPLPLDLGHQLLDLSLNVLFVAKGIPHIVLDSSQHIFQHLAASSASRLLDFIS